MNDKELQEQRKWYELIDHTADTGFSVRGQTLEQLHEHSAFALFDIMADLRNVTQKESRNIEVKAKDREALLVDWLSELNYLFFTEGLISCNFEVAEIRDDYIRARIKGERYNPSVHIIRTEIKAVTYHGIYIHQRDGKWEAQVILDL